MNKGVFLLILATIFWAGNYICGRYLADALPPTLLNTIRWVISSIILFILSFFKKKRIHLLANWKEFFIAGFFGVFAFSTLTYWGLNHLGASQVGMITAFSPVCILLFSFLILKERISLQAIIGTVVSITGVIILFVGKSTGVGSGSWLGGLAIIFASLSWGVYTALGKKYSQRFDALTMTTGAAFYGTILSIISCIGTVNPNRIHMTPEAWLAIIYVSTFASVAAFLAWNIGVQIVGSAHAAPLMNLLPVWTILLGVVILQESMSLLSFIGGSISIIGALLTSLPRTVTKRIISHKHSEKL